MNRETLKQAIAEAKTIKETAIANAKLALEEAFTPQLTAMFAEKLNEMDKEEEEANKSMEERYSTEEDSEENFNIEDILAELEMTSEGDEMKEKDMNAGVDENLMLEEMSDEDIEALVAQVIDDMIASGKLMAGEESEEEDMEDEEDMMGDEDEEIDIDIEDDEEKDIDETIAEILAEMEEGDGVTETMSPEILTNIIDAAMATATAGKIAAAIGGTATAASVIAALKGLKSDIKKEKEGNLEETFNTIEMEETISELRNELNEVNLLNAKLLYTNKIFKAKNLTESDKVKVLNAFDKAENVKGVKLVYETLTESLKATSIVKKSQVRESLGSASRTITPATPKQPIIESNEAFARMQRLAGIKK